MHHGKILRRLVGNRLARNVTAVHMPLEDDSACRFASLVDVEANHLGPQQWPVERHQRVLLPEAARGNDANHKLVGV